MAAQERHPGAPASAPPAEDPPRTAAAPRPVRVETVRFSRRVASFFALVVLVVLGGVLLAALVGAAAAVIGEALRTTVG